MASCDDLIYKEKDLPYECYRTFRDMRQKKEFCDVTLNVGNNSIHAHKVILAACIPYFRTLFGHNGEENREKELSMENVCPEALEALVDFAYTCELKITSGNVQMLLIAASFLQVDHVKKACVKFLINTLTPADAISLRDLGFKIDCLDMVNKIDDYVRENFVDVSECEGFQFVPYLYLRELISSDNLHVSSEEKVFEAVIRWVKAQRDKQSSELPALLSCIRMPYLNLYYLRDVVANDELVKASLQCRDILDDARDYHLFPEKRHDTNVSWKFVCTPRQYRSNTSESEIAFTAEQRSRVSGDDSFMQRGSSRETVAAQSKRISNFCVLRNRQRKDNLNRLKILSYSTEEIPVCKTSELIASVPTNRIPVSSGETIHNVFTPYSKFGRFNFMEKPKLCNFPAAFSFGGEEKILERPKRVPLFPSHHKTVDAEIKPKLFP